MKKTRKEMFEYAFGDFTEREIRALWWKQPYAQLMLHGKIETRTKPTKVRGLVLICSTIKPYTDNEVLVISGQSQLLRIENHRNYDFANELNGYAIGIGVLVNCWQMRTEDVDRCYVDKTEGRYCWCFEMVHPIHPFPLKGKQGWAILDKETKSKIKLLQYETNINQSPQDGRAKRVKSSPRKEDTASPQTLQEKPPQLPADSQNSGIRTRTGTP